MILGKILGAVVLSKMDEKLKGKTLLIVQPLNENEQPFGKPLIAIDMMGAGFGETILMVKGKEAVLRLPEPHPPIDYGVNAIVDDIFIVKEAKKRKE
ncbi:EutN/CcmL family microcompartment protein [Candidatus Dependentiae bacterium]|nr:EutN/CcmL family microcompartment protein [Candidatus Dependentiae bacterium]